MFIFSAVTDYQPGIISFVKALLPVSFETYWYFTAYFWLIVLVPVLDLIVRKADGKGNCAILLIVFVLQELSDTVNGLFSIMLLAYLYCVGAIVKKTKVFEIINSTFPANISK